MSLREAVDPFAVAVGAEEDDVSLASVVAQTAVSLVDLRRLNPDLDAYAHTQPLPPGTVVRLPPLLDQQGSPCGNFFTIGPMEEALRSLDARLDAMVEKEGRQLPQLPKRKIMSKTERIVTTVREESERQLVRIKDEYAECKKRPKLLQFLVDVEPIKKLRKDLEEEFDGSRLGLSTLDRANQEIFGKELRPRENVITENSRWNLRDSSDDFCLEEHSHRWEFTFFTPESSLEVQDSWAVLSCQNLGVLFDTFECRNCLPMNTSKNAFMFIGGTFYVDNRHAGVQGENYEDLTVPIRNFCPVQEEGGASVGGGNLAFGQCPVKYVSQTTFADLHLRLGEFGVFRHLGWCNHYFYLSSVETLRGLETSERDRRAYPQRVMKLTSRAVRCHMCRQFPATVACYNDELSPDNPCPYCVPCFELLHATDEGVVEEGNFLAVKLPGGKYFTM